MRTTFLVAATGLAFHASLAAQVGTWVQNPANGHYYGLTTQMSWTDAEALAVQIGGHLATIRSAAENDWLATTFAIGTECHWIGLNDAASEGHFVWSSGEPVTYTNWHPGEPTNGNGIEDWCHLGLPWTGPQAYPFWNDSPNGDTSYGWVCRGIIEVTNLTPALYTPFGTGCPAPDGSVPMLAPVAGELPRVGTTSHLRVSNLPLALTIPVFVVGFSDSTAAAGYALPFDLAPLGWPGCEQLVSNEILYWTITTTGQADQAFAIPAAAPVGFEFFVQALVLHTPAGASVSNGIAARVGY